MKIKRHVLQENVTVTFTPDEIDELILICQGDKVLNSMYKRDFKRNSKWWKEYESLEKMAERMQNKFIDILYTGPIIEEEI